LLAQAAPPEQSLTDPRILNQLNALEQAAAQANQATYNALFNDCVNETAACTPDVLRVFEETRELVHTANALLGTGAVSDSLGLDIQGLGFALRWTAAEELAAQGSITTVFAASQMSALSARLSSLRWGVSGPRTTFLQGQGDDTVRVASSGTFRSGGGASADSEEIFSRWSWYVDGSFGYGSKDPTVLEDAFDFDGQEISTGLDYRISPRFVVGGMLGFTAKEVDFDSALSIVDGGIESSGYSGMAYGMWEGESAYVNAALGYQQLSHDTRRRITYPSQNPLIPPVDSRATSSTDSGSVLATLGGGVTLRWGSFNLEPSAEFAYTDVSVDSFVEDSVDLFTNSPDDPFALRVGSQSIESLDAALGLRASYVFTPALGVVIPYVSVRYHQEMLNDTRRIAARYADAYELLLSTIAGDPNFNVPTDAPDEEYFTVAGGVSVVLQRGLMGYLQYLEVLELDNYSDSVITGGVRYEFGR
jgi:uncharacterized protein YhjY with autotransporter beta-barrel domain